jgi:hypothetical protein
MRQEISSWRTAQTNRVAAWPERSACIKRLGGALIFALLFLLMSEKPATAFPFLKENICAIFPVERIAREIDAGYGYEHDEKQVYDTYREIINRIIQVYRSEILRLKEKNSTISEAYNAHNSTEYSTNYQCDYTFAVEYNAKRLGIITTDQWIPYLDYDVYTKNQRYVSGVTAFSRYELRLDFSRANGDLLKIYIRKYNINFDKFPSYLMKHRYGMTGREVGLSLKKENFPVD